MNAEKLPWRLTYLPPNPDNRREAYPGPLAQHLKSQMSNSGRRRRNKCPGKKPLSFAGLCFGASWHAARKITRPGLEQLPGNIGETALSVSGGHPGGQFGSDSETVASLRQQALTSLQLAWRDIRRMESLSDDPAESKVAGRALAFVNRAFEELEEGKR